MGLRRQSKKRSVYFIVVLLVLAGIVGGWIAMGLTVKPPVQTLVHHEITEPQTPHEESGTSAPSVESL